MLAKKVILALVLTMFLATWAWADGGFYGTVKYHGCTCDRTDRVCIKLVSPGQECHYFYLERCGGV